MSPTQPLTPAQHRRIRLNVALIPVYVWLVIVWTTYAIDISPAGRLDRSGHIKGHDFAHFYVLGQIANEHAAEDLYSFESQARRMDRLVPEYENRFLPIHSPQVAVFFAPLAGLPYEQALTLWLLLSVAIYAGVCYAIWRACPSLRGHGWVVLLLAAAFPGFYGVITFGQTSVFALLWLTLGFFALKNNRPWLAGLALGSLAYKPTLVLVLPLAFLYARQFTVVGAACLAALVQFGVAWVYFGTSAIAGYVHNFRAAAEFTDLLEARPEFMHSLKSFFLILLPSASLATAAYAATALIVAVAAVRAWRTPGPLHLRYAVLLLATVLVNPHVYTYELLVLVPAFMLIAAWVAEGDRRTSWFLPVLGLCYALPAFDALTRLTRIQLSVPALVALAFMTARAGTRPLSDTRRPTE